MCWISASKLHPSTLCVSRLRLIFRLSVCRYRQFEKETPPPWTILQAYAPETELVNWKPHDDDTFDDEAPMLVVVEDCGGVWTAKHIIEVNFLEETDEKINETVDMRGLLKSGSLVTPDFDVDDYHVVAAFHVRERLPFSLTYDLEFHTHVARSGLPASTFPIGDNDKILDAHSKLIYMFVTKSDVSHPLISCAVLPRGLCACCLIHDDDLKHEFTDKIPGDACKGSLVGDQIERCPPRSANPLDVLFRLAPRVGDDVIVVDAAEILDEVPSAPPPTPVDLSGNPVTDPEMIV